jgi:hypothetical protein
MFHLTFYVPASHLEAVKTAVFEAGGGRIGNYDRCSWQVRGTGQFRPLAGANPHLGRVGAVEAVDEWRVELVVAEEYLQAVVAALRQAHPYEEPAYGVVRLEAIP